jgi:co-chaperonin GroES (HSP10)
MTNIKPLGKLLLVKEIEVTESKTSTGLILTATSTEQDLKKATVIDIGPGEVSSFNGTLYPVESIKIGMLVYYSPNHATEIKDSNGDKYYFVNSGMLFGYEEQNA